MARSKLPDARPDPVTEAISAAASSWAAGTRVCVAFSGGSDSTVLLHALASARAKSGGQWTLSAHHVHHGLSANADAWAAHCAAICDTLDVSFSAQRVSVDRQAGIGIEAAAREARMHSLDQVNADWILFAHHAQDQAETLLLQLLRGSGPPGMAAMPSATRRFLRPFLSVTKAALVDYAATHGLRWIDDESNADNRFSRNRLRNTVWPRLIEAFPAAETTLSRAALHQADAALLLDDLAAIDAANCILDYAIELSAFNQLSPARRANLLRHWLRCNNVKPPASETLREWLQQLRATSDIQAIELRGAGHANVIRVYRGRAHLTRDAMFWNPCTWLEEASLPLATHSTVVGTLYFSQAAQASALRTRLPGEKWTVRMRQDGDAIALSPRSGHVALKNVFQQANIPPWLRSTWPLLLCDDEIVAVASIATAKAFTVAEGESGWMCEWKPATFRHPDS
jgi:tRNA(Ile)-lysidine synthase